MNSKRIFLNLFKEIVKMKKKKIEDRVNKLAFNQMNIKCLIILKRVKRNRS